MISLISTLSNIERFSQMFHRVSSKYKTKENNKKKNERNLRSIDVFRRVSFTHLPTASKKRARRMARSQQKRIACIRARWMKHSGTSGSRSAKCGPRYGFKFSMYITLISVRAPRVQPVPEHSDN